MAGEGAPVRFGRGLPFEGELGGARTRARARGRGAGGEAPGDAALAAALQQEEDAVGARALGRELAGPRGVDGEGDEGSARLQRALSADGGHGFPGRALERAVRAAGAVFSKLGMPGKKTAGARPAEETAAAAARASVPEERGRLQLRLDMYALEERAVRGDGNCQFASLSDQLFGSPQYHEEIRALVARQLRDGRGRYEGFVGEEWGTYCARVARTGEWGDHVTLQAAADGLGCAVQLITSFSDGAVLSIDPEFPQSERVLWLSFWAEVHYNSLAPRAPSGA